MVKKAQSISGTILNDADFWQKIMPTMEQRNSSDRSLASGYESDAVNNFPPGEQQPLNVSVYNLSIFRKFTQNKMLFSNKT